MKHTDTGTKTAAGTRSPLWRTRQLVAVIALHSPPLGATTIVSHQESTQSCYMIKPHNLTLCSICCAASEHLWDDIEVASGSSSESHEKAQMTRLTLNFVVSGIGYRTTYKCQGHYYINLCEITYFAIYGWNQTLSITSQHWTRSSYTEER